MKTLKATSAWVIELAIAAALAVAKALIRMFDKPRGPEPD